MTTYKAVKVAGTRSSDLVAVFGVGGLGHLAIQYAAIAGGRVVAIDLVDEKLELARELGAEFIVNAAKEDPVAAIQELGGADQAIALAVAPKAFEQAYSSLRRGGTLVFVALPAENKIHAADLRDRAERDHARRLDRRHPDRSARGVRAARRRQDARHPRDAAAVGDQRGDRGRRAGRVPARIVFDPG